MTWTDATWTGPTTTPPGRPARRVQAEDPLSRGVEPQPCGRTSEGAGRSTRVPSPARSDLDGEGSRHARRSALPATVPRRSSKAIHRVRLQGDSSLLSEVSVQDIQL